MNAIVSQNQGIPCVIKNTGLPLTMPETVAGGGLPTTGLLVRWDVDSLAGSSNDDPIGTLVDQSGNSRDATQSNSSLKPLYKTNIFGTSPSIYFNAGTQFDYTPIALPNFTFIGAVLASNPDAYSNGIMGWGLGSGDQSGFVLTGQNHHIVTLNSSGTETNNLHMNVPVGGKTILTWTFDGTTVHGRTNGAEVSPLLTGDAGFPGVRTKVGFAYANRSGYISAIFVYNTVLSAGDITTVENYLNGKYPCF